MFEAWCTFVFVFLAVILPWSGARRMKALSERPPGALPIQRWLYPRIIVSQWFLTLAVVLVLWKLGVPLRALGLAAPHLVPLLWTVAVLAVAWVIWERRLRRAVREPARRAKLLARFANMRLLVPLGRSMLPGWIAVSFTAGICEETLFRGYFGFYLGQWMPLWAVALVGSALFGVAHAYQGPRGVVRTGLAGLLLWATYLATGSILPAMVLHAAIDVRSGSAIRAALEAEAAEAATAAEAPTPTPGPAPVPAPGAP